MPACEAPLDDENIGTLGTLWLPWAPGLLSAISPMSLPPCLGPYTSRFATCVAGDGGQASLAEAASMAGPLVLRLRHAAQQQMSLHDGQSQPVPPALCDSGRYSW